MRILQLGNGEKGKEKSKVPCKVCCGWRQSSSNKKITGGTRLVLLSLKEGEKFFWGRRRRIIGILISTEKAKTTKLDGDYNDDNDNKH